MEFFGRRERERAKGLLGWRAISQKALLDEMYYGGGGGREGGRERERERREGKKGGGRI